MTLRTLRKTLKIPQEVFFRLSPSDYEGLHSRYARLLGEDGMLLANATDRLTLAQRDELRAKFEKMMRSLFTQQGAEFKIGIMVEKPVQDFIDTHASTLDTSIEKVEMSDAMRQRLTRSNWIFSGLKTFHELNEAFPSLIDENGERKPFERFLNDVQKIDETYNRNYLNAEYEFVHSSAAMAAKWEGFMKDGNRYYLQYRTAGDNRVRPEHAALNRVTLPIDDPFWASYYPPNGWRCRCTAVQVRKSKQPATPHDEAMSLGEEALQKDTKGIFRFNSGKQQKTMPDYNPYTVKRCRDCDIAKGKISLAKNFQPDNQLCQACKYLRGCYEQKNGKDFKEYIKDNIQEAERIEDKVHKNLQTRTYYQTRKSFKRAIGHARNVEQAEMYADINNYISKLRFVRNSPLGEGKDMHSQKDKDNVQKKIDRGVTSYNVYELELGNEKWVVKTEVYRNSCETVYALYKKE